MITSDKDIAGLVTAALKANPQIGRIDVMKDAVRHEDDWWYVPILPSGEITKSEQYYDLLADIEDDLREREGINVTLVPTSNIIKLMPHRTTLRPMHVFYQHWEILCGAAGVNHLRGSYDRSECQRIAEQIGKNPQILPFDPPGRFQEVVDFLRESDGVETR